MAADSSVNDPLIGRIIAGRYRIISRLGAGGMGTAYRAWDEQSGVPVVVKSPKKVFLDDPTFAERFRREIRLLQGLAHPHIVPITDVGMHEDLPFVVMRFLPGGSLSNRRLRDEQNKPRPNPPGMLHLWLPAVAEALDYVHAHGVIHRDVKPANIFFDAFWGAYLGDFGIAKIVEESETFDKEHTLTASHMGIGTQEYMCPEQFTPRAVLDGRADQYALAVMVYEMVAGTRPFTGTTAHLIVEVATQQPPPLHTYRHDLPPSLAEAVYRGLSKNPAQRYATCREFAAAVLRDVQPLESGLDLARLLCPNPKCSRILSLKTSAAGRRGKCPNCHMEMKVADDLGALWLLDEAPRQQDEVTKHREDAAWDEEFDEYRTSYVPGYFASVDDGKESNAAALDRPVSTATAIKEDSHAKAEKPSRWYALYKRIEAVWVGLWLFAFAAGLVNGCVLKPLIRGCVPERKPNGPSKRLSSDDTKSSGPTPSPTTSASQTHARPALKNSMGIELKLIPPGACPTGSNHGKGDEKPGHEVRIMKPFHLVVTEAPNTQWTAVMGDMPGKWPGDDRLDGQSRAISENESWEER